MSEIVSLGPDLTRLLDWLPLPAFVRSRQGALCYVNAALISLTGGSFERSVGRNIAEFLPQDATQRLKEEDRKVLAGEIIHSETTFCLPDQDRDFTLLVSKRRAWHPEWGDVIVGIGQDVTHRRSSEQDETLAFVRHELQTPLSAISGLSELLLESPLSREQQDSLRLILSTAESCRALLADMLDASRPTLGKWSLRPSEFSLRDFLNAVIKPFELRVDAKRLRFRQSIADDVQDLIYCDTLRLRQVIQNLLENAIKFTETGSIEVSVTTAPDLNMASAIQITVSDTGIGIPRDKLPVIFQPFVQAHDWSSRRYGGTGLGLSIVSHIVTLMGGRIWVESEPSKGSVFSFVIPVQAQREETTSEVEAGDGFDWKSALAIAGGDASLLKELAGLFLQEYPKLIGDLRAAVEERDPKKLDTSAHALKGAVANFGAKAAVEAALWLESKGRAAEIEGVDKALASLERALEPLLVELEALSKS